MDSLAEALSDDHESNSDQKCSVIVKMWEFDQNDPKRDSGSKLCRLGLAKNMRIGDNFSGLVLSSESRIYASKADLDIITDHGIAGINCSWNRIDEIPFKKLGRSRNHRLLPILFAANSVNYGKPYKLNTAEAIAATLYICGFVDDAQLLLSSFSYGPEFLRLNHSLLEKYRNCSDSESIIAAQEEYLSSLKLEQVKKEEKRKAREGSNYLDESDLPPITDYDDYDDCDVDGTSDNGESY